MPISKSTIKTAYPLPVYNYKVTILDNGNNISMGFSDVTGLNVEHESVVYKHGLSHILGVEIIRGAKNLPIKLTLKRGIIYNEHKDFLYQWFKNSGEKKDLLINLCDEAGKALVSWKVKKAMPVKMDAPTFSSTSNDVALESVDLVAHDLTMEYN